MQASPIHPVDERLPTGRLAALGLQHVLVMYAGAVAVPLIVGRALKLSPEQVALLISADLFCCGIVTLIQSFGVTQWFGVRLPVMMGVTFAAVGPMVAMANANPGAAGAQAACERLAANVHKAPALIGGPGPFGVFHHVEPDIAAPFGTRLRLGRIEQLPADAAPACAGQQIDPGDFGAARTLIDRLEQTDVHDQEADANAVLPRDPHTRLGPGERRQHRLGAKRLQLVEEADRVVPVVMIGGGVGGRTDDADIGGVGRRGAGDRDIGQATFTIAALSGSSCAKAR